MIDLTFRVVLGLAALGVSVPMGFAAFHGGVHPLTAIATFGIAGFILFDVSRDPSDT